MWGKKRKLKTKNEKLYGTSWRVQTTFIIDIFLQIIMLSLYSSTRFFLWFFQQLNKISTLSSSFTLYTYMIFIRIRSKYAWLWNVLFFFFFGFISLYLFHHFLYHIVSSLNSTQLKRFCILKSFTITVSYNSSLSSSQSGYFFVFSVLLPFIKLYTFSYFLCKESYRFYVFSCST